MVAALSLLASGCKQEVQFTRTPFPAPADADPRLPTSTIQAGLPVELSGAIEKADAAVPEALGKAVEWVNDGACFTRGKGTQCEGARVDVELQRAGAMTVDVVDGRLMLSLPIKYELSARGVGPARDVTDKKTGSLIVGVPIEAALGAGFKTEVRLRDELTWSEPELRFLQRGKLATGKLLDGRVKRVVKPAADVIAAALAELPFRDLAERAWRGVHAPLALADAPAAWVRGEGERITGLGFAREDTRIVYRLAIVARFALHEGNKPAPLAAKRLPDPVRPTAATPEQTSVRVTRIVGYGPVLKALAAAFPKDETLRSEVDPKRAPTGVRVRELSLYPSRHLLTLEMMLDVFEPAEFSGRFGRAHLTARPVFGREPGLITLEGIQLPEVKTAPSRDGKAAPRQPQIGLEPFAGRFHSAVRLDVRPEIEATLKRLNSPSGRAAEGGISLKGAFERGSVVAVDPVRDGFRLTIEAQGALSLTIDPATQQVGIAVSTGSTQ